MKNNLYKFLSKPYIVIVVMIIAPILSIADRNFGYFFGLFVALFLLWQSGWNWAKFGFGKKINLYCHSALGAVFIVWMLNQVQHDKIFIK